MVTSTRPAIGRHGADPPLPDTPSIVVLPFANLSGDPEQEYFVDGMVEEIITLSPRLQKCPKNARISKGFGGMGCAGMIPIVSQIVLPKQCPLQLTAKAGSRNFSRRGFRRSR